MRFCKQSEKTRLDQALLRIQHITNGLLAFFALRITQNHLVFRGNFLSRRAFLPLIVSPCLAFADPTHPYLSPTPEALALILAMGQTNFLFD